MDSWTIRIPFMAAADILVHAARFEPFGIVYTEALSLGLPVVATDCPGGPGPIFDGGQYGLLTPEGDQEALAAGILRLAEDPGLRRDLSAKGPERANDYAPEIIAAQMAAVADSMSGTSPSASGHYSTQEDNR